MDETIYVILKLMFDFALEVWFSIDRHLSVQNITQNTKNSFENNPLKIHTYGQEAYV